MEENEHTLSLRLSNELGELSRLQEVIESLPGRMNLPPGMIMPINLALEEAFTNIVNYAFNDKDPHAIGVDITRREKRLEIRITDDGRPYDPTAREDPDVALPAEDRKVGGLGIFLIKKIMDEVVYRRENEKNILTLIKSLPI
jgi:anti-sigma regulatory factor (Ser/Thr protein kinase)